MRIGLLAMALVLALALAILALSPPAQAQRSGFPQDFGPPMAEEDPANVSTTTPLMIDRCKALLRSMKIDKQGNILDYDHDYRAGFCLGWINAATAFMNFRDFRGESELGVCLPKDIDSKIVIEAFLAFAARYDEALGYNPSYLIYWSLLEKYPCKKK